MNNIFLISIICIEIGQTTKSDILENSKFQQSMKIETLKYQKNPQK